MDIGQAIEEQERLVLRTAYRLLGRWEDARDAAQEVFLKLHRSADRFDPDRPLGPWLHRVTVNTCRDAYRRGRVSEELLEARSEGRDPEDLAMLEQQRRLLHAALEQLPERERLAIVLREIEGLSTEEVAGRLGSSVETVRSQISTGRAKLRRILAGMAVAGVGLMVWMLWPRRMALEPPAAVVAQMPKAPLQPADRASVPARRPRTLTAGKSEPLVIKLVTEDESIVIYWTESKKGEEE